MQIKKYARRRNRKIKFSEDQYIQKYYMKNEKAIIPIDLNNVEELYMKHDHKKMELSNSVCEYIEEIAYMVPINIDIVLEIHCPNLTKAQKEKMKKAIRNNYGMEIDEIEYDINMQNRKSINLLVIGIILLIINIFTDKYMGNILSNFICVVWWVAFWNVIEIQAMEKIENKEKRLNYQQLYDSEIKFINEKDK